MFRLLRSAKQVPRPQGVPATPIVSMMVEETDPLPPAVGGIRFSFFEETAPLGMVHMGIADPCDLFGDERKVDNRELLARARRAWGPLPGVRHAYALSTQWNKVPREWSNFVLVIGGAIWLSTGYWGDYIPAPSALTLFPQRDGRWSFEENKGGFYFQGNSTRKNAGFRFVRFVNPPHPDTSPVTS